MSEPYIQFAEKGFFATVIAHSVNSEGDELLTLSLRYPRFIHADFMSHREFSRNASSSRAIPVKKLLEQVRNDPAMPIYWGKNQPGMQAAEELDDTPGSLGVLFEKSHAFSVQDMAKWEWSKSSRQAADTVEFLNKLGLHKQIANRILEPWMWMHTIVTSTNYDHFFNLRRHKDAQPEIQLLADLIHEAKNASIPVLLEEGQWHLPYVTSADEVRAFFSLSHGSADNYGRPVNAAGPDPEDFYFQKLSVARCARVSYLNHDGTNPDPKKDLDLHDRLIAQPHASPFEHQATPKSGRHANFTGWLQYRKLIPNEYRSANRYVGKET